MKTVLRKNQIQTLGHENQLMRKQTHWSCVIALIIGLTSGTSAMAAIDAEKVLANWPAQPKLSAEKIIAKYGAPKEVTDSNLIWYNNGPWKRTNVGRVESPHDFPKPHTDLMVQTIDYRVPPEKMDELAAYDGSVFVERTVGELSARCDKEEANFLALNLAHDIIIGKKTVAEARKFYTDAVAAMEKGEKPPYTQAFQFKVASGDTGFKDQVTIKK